MLIFLGIVVLVLLVWGYSVYREHQEEVAFQEAICLSRCAPVKPVTPEAPKVSSAPAKKSTARKSSSKKSK